MSDTKCTYPGCCIIGGHYHRDTPDGEEVIRITNRKHIEGSSSMNETARQELAKACTKLMDTITGGKIENVDMATPMFRALIDSAIEHQIEEKK